MKPSPFDYHAPAGLDEALDVLARVGPDGKVLAGGQSLIPLLNMRLAAPAHLVDINRLTGLDTIEAGPSGVRVGALARHSAVERSVPAAVVQPLLGRALRLVAHPVIRNRGTVVGSLVHADPSAELPAVLALLGGSVRLAHRGGEREVPAAEFFIGPMESAVRPGELAVSAFFPALVLGIFWKRASKWGAIIGMAAGLAVCMYYMSVTYPFMREVLGITTPIAELQWFGINAISAGVFGVPVGFATIVIVSLLTPQPSREVQELVDHVRYPVLAGDIDTRAT